MRTSSLKPGESSYLAAVVVCMTLLAVSFYHFPISYWLKYIGEAPSDFAYTVFSETVWQLVFGEMALFLVFAGMMLCMLCIKYQKRKLFHYLGAAMVETGIFLETGIPFIFLNPHVSPVDMGGLYWIYLMYFAPFVLLFSIFFIYSVTRNRVEDPRVLYSTLVIVFIPVSLNVAQWILSGYVGTGGGLFLLALLFFISWALIWLGGLFGFRFGSSLIITGAILNWSPYGVGLIMLGLSYMLRAEQYSRKFLAAVIAVFIFMAF